MKTAWRSCTHDAPACYFVTTQLLKQLIQTYQLTTFSPFLHIIYLILAYYIYFNYFFIFSDFKPRQMTWCRESPVGFKRFPTTSDPKNCLWTYEVNCPDVTLRCTKVTCTKYVVSKYMTKKWYRVQTYNFGNDLLQLCWWVPCNFPFRNPDPPLSV